MSQEKIFVGNAKLREVNPTFKYVRIGFNLEDLNKMSSHIGSGGWVNLNLMKNDKGYYLEVDTWKPQAQTEVPQQKPAGDNDNVMF